MPTWNESHYFLEDIINFKNSIAFKTYIYARILIREWFDHFSRWIDTFLIIQTIETIIARFVAYLVPLTIKKSQVAHEKTKKIFEFRFFRANYYETHCMTKEYSCLDTNFLSVAFWRICWARIRSVSSLSNWSIITKDTVVWIFLLIGLFGMNC